MTAADLDGDKDVKEGAAGEIATLEEKLYAAIQDYAKNVAKAAIVYDAGCLPVLLSPMPTATARSTRARRPTPTFTPRLLKAAYNYQYSQKDPGIFAHNLDYAARSSTTRWKT